MNLKTFILMSFALVAGNAFAQNGASTTAPVQQAVTDDLDVKYGAELLKPGADAPDITLSTIDGKPFALSSMRGKYVVLDFWASWCPDCRKDAPIIVALHDKFAAKGVEFVGVSFDKTREAWRAGVEKLGIKYTQVGDLKPMRDSEVAKAYHVKWIPTMYVIDPQGKVALATVMSDKVSALLHTVYPDCAE